MDAHQLRHEIVRPALQLIGMYSPAAECLVMGTAAQESRLAYVRQIKGPALSLWQMEPATHDDIWQHWLVYKPDVQQDVLAAIYVNTPPDAERLVWDLRYGAIMCRLHYRRQPEALPAPDDIWSMAAYWKRTYNTALGKGTEQEFVRNYALVM